MNKQNIVTLLKDSNQEQVEKFASYIIRLFLEKDRKTGNSKNIWIQKKTDQQMVDLFKRVEKDGLVFDGEHITLQSTGISYDYVAYKNKMLLVYPDSIIDVQLVYEGDDFSFSKENGKVVYDHTISNPFGQKDDKIIGGYCVIKNKRGDFLTTLSKDDIDKHRKVAKTDYIWRNWFKEMAMKTVIKKAVKYHFSDIYTEIESSDNEQYDLENPVDLDLKYKQEIEAIDDVMKLKEYYMKNKGKGKGFDKLIQKRKDILLNN